jgi:hypothetical protein
MQLIGCMRVWSLAELTACTESTAAVGGRSAASCYDNCRGVLLLLLVLVISCLETRASSQPIACYVRINCVADGEFHVMNTCQR